jgi:hypothetical protein
MVSGNEGVIGGLVGSVIGVLGGAVGTWFSIRNTASPRERAFMVRVAVAAWIIITAFLAALMLVPQPYTWLLWIPYGIGLPVGILWTNRRQAQIRREDAQRPPA